jgi:hypothetical protein
MMGFLVRGQVNPGIIPAELAVPGDRFMDEIRRRAIKFETYIEKVEN